MSDSDGVTPRSVELIDWDRWVPRERAVICYLIDKDSRKILLIHKKTGLGAGKINAPGGRIEPGESAVDAAIRECQEEVGVTPRAPQKRGELFFQFTDGYSLFGEVFFALQWNGEPRESLEADPFWSPLDSIPYDQMWEDDKLWLPQAIEGNHLRGYFIFDGDSMLSEKIEQADYFGETRSHIV